MTLQSYTISQTAPAGDQHANLFTFIYNFNFDVEIED
jgi:hypothetical protein